jgi:hypothetical protein
MNRDHERIEHLIRRLEDLGCPNRITEELRDWNDEPLRSAIDLREWIEGCIESDPECMKVATKRLG